MPGEHRAQHGDHERLQVVGGDAGRHGRRAPDDHHEHRDDDGRREEASRPQSTASAGTITRARLRGAAMEVTYSWKRR